MQSGGIDQQEVDRFGTFAAPWRLIRSFRRHRTLLIAGADALAWAVCITVAILLRYQLNTEKSFTPDLLIIIAVAAFMQWTLGAITPLYRVRWRTGSFEEIVCLASTVLAVTVAVTAVSFIPNQHVVPASATVGGGALALVCAAGLRVSWRLHGERHRQP